MKEHGGHFGETLPRQLLRLSLVFVAVSAAIVVAIQGNAGLAHGEEFDDESLRWEVALDNIEPAESYDPIPDNLQDFSWTWQERASQAANQIRHTYPDDFSWFEFAPEAPGALIGFADEIPEGAVEIINTLRSYGEGIEVFDEQRLTERELLAANLYLTAAADKKSGTITTVEMHLGDSPVITVAGAESEEDAVGPFLTQHLSIVAEKTGEPTLRELPIEFDAPLDRGPIDPVYDGMVLGPQPHAGASGNAMPAPRGAGGS